MFDYVVSLREGIIDAWNGIIGAMKGSGKSRPLFAMIQDCANR
jgi:importin subunit beta-1